ncbi:MAG: hypothetical protein HYZ95_03265 [Candidatus Omnitrophica bacterium]|nr:hypothetical protein [Candidatus Omnitrophota bacterium]
MRAPRGAGTGRALLLSVGMLGFLLPFAAPPARSEMESAVRVMQGLRTTLRETKEAVPSEWVSRAEADLSWQRWWKLMPLLEARRDVDNGRWSRIEAGAEVGWQPFSWVYLGNAVHQAWVSPGSDRPEWEVRTIFTWPLPWKVRSERISLYGLTEWTFDIEIGEGSRNELAAGFRVPLPWKPFSSMLGWRHVDLIHGPDIDQFEGVLQAEF